MLLSGMICEFIKERSNHLDSSREILLVLADAVEDMNRPDSAPLARRLRSIMADLQDLVDALMKMGTSLEKRNVGRFVRATVRPTFLRKIKLLNSCNAMLLKLAEYIAPETLTNMGQVSRYDPLTDEVYRSARTIRRKTKTAQKSKKRRSRERLFRSH